MPGFSMEGPVQIHPGIFAGQVIPFRSKPCIIEFIAIGNMNIPVKIRIIKIIVDRFQVQPLLVLGPGQVLDSAVLHGCKFSHGKLIK